MHTNMHKFEFLGQLTQMVGIASCKNPGKANPCVRSMLGKTSISRCVDHKIHIRLLDLLVIYISIIFDYIT